MAIALEKHQERVAAELQEAAAIRVGHLQHGREAGADGVGQVLGSLVATACEALRQAGETRHVDEDDRSRDTQQELLRGRCEMAQQNARHVRIEWTGPVPAHGRQAYACGGRNS